MLVSLSFPVLAEEPRVYTEQDLEKYKTYSTYDRETTIQRELALKQWEKEKWIEEELLREKKEDEEMQEAKKQSEAVGKQLMKKYDDGSANRIKKKRT